MPRRPGTGGRPNAVSWPRDGGCGCGVVVVVVVVIFLVVVGFVGISETSSSHDGHHRTRRWKGYEGRLNWWKGDVMSGVVDR